MRQRASSEEQRRWRGLGAGGLERSPRLAYPGQCERAHFLYGPEVQTRPRNAPEWQGLVLEAWAGLGR